MPTIVPVQRAKRRKQTAADVAGPVRCARCGYRMRPLVAASSVRLAEAAAQDGEIDAHQAAAALILSRSRAGDALLGAVAEGLLLRTRAPLSRGGFSYRYRAAAAAASYVQSDALARRITALGSLAPAGRLG
jgi:hypothetical protein